MECGRSLNSAFKSCAAFFRDKSYTFKRRYSEGLSLYFWFQRLLRTALKIINKIEHFATAMTMDFAKGCERWETNKWLCLSRLQFYSFFFLISSAKNTTDQLLKITRLPHFALNFLSQSPASLLSGDETYCYLFLPIESFYSSFGLDDLKKIYFGHRGLNVAKKQFLCFFSRIPYERHQLKP